MHTVQELRMNELLSQEQWRYVDEQAFWAARNLLMGRRITRTTPPLGFGVEAVSFDTYSEVSDADISYAWSEEAISDIAVKSRTTISVPIIRKDVRIGRRKLAASQRALAPLDTTSIDSSVYKCTTKEDSLLYMGIDWDNDGTYELEGYYTGADNDYSTSKDWGTASAIDDSILGAIALLMADKILPPYNLSVHPTQYAQAMALRDYTDASYTKLIDAWIQGMTIPVSVMTAGTALMSKDPLAGFFDAAITQDLTIERNVTPGKNLHVIIFEALVPRIKDANSLCKLSKI